MNRFFHINDNIFAFDSIQHVALERTIVSGSDMNPITNESVVFYFKNGEYTKIPADSHVDACDMMKRFFMESRESEA